MLFICLIGERGCGYGDIIRAIIKESADGIQLSREKAMKLLERILSEQCRIIFNGSENDGENRDISVG